MARPLFFFFTCVPFLNFDVPNLDASALVHTVSLVSAAKNCVFARTVQVVTRSVVIVIVHLAGEAANAIDVSHFFF